MSKTFFWNFRPKNVRHFETGGHLEKIFLRQRPFIIRFKSMKYEVNLSNSIRVIIRMKWWKSNKNEIFCRKFSKSKNIWRAKKFFFCFFLPGMPGNEIWAKLFFRKFLTKKCPPFWNRRPSWKNIFEHNSPYPKLYTCEVWSQSLKGYSSYRPDKKVWRTGGFPISLRTSVRWDNYDPMVEMNPVTEYINVP